MEAVTSLPRSYALVRERLAILPVSPGVYLFRDAAGQIVYIGKSVCLRKRVRSYFYVRQDDSSKLRRLRREIRSVEWICTGSELEALLLESRLVKQHQPPFNVFLRHYRHYPFIKVDLRDDYPRLIVTRHLERDGALYYGPFRNGRGVQEVIDALADALQLRTCEADGRRLAGMRPCLRRDLGRCMAPCVEAAPGSRLPAPGWDGPGREPGAGSRELPLGHRYAQAVKEACELFDGRSDRVFRMLTDRMERAAAHLHFETAARLRDAFVQIRQLVGKQQALTSAVRNLSLVAVCPSSRAEQVELFLFSRGRLVMQREVTRAQWEEEAARNAFVEEMLGRYSTAQAEGSLQVEQEVVDQINIVADWLKNRTGEGQHRELPENPECLAPGSRETAALSSWLRAAAAEVVAHSGRSTPCEELRNQLALELEG